MARVTVRPARYSGKCSVCKGRIVEGQEIAYDGRTRCMRCYRGAEPVSAPVEAPVASRQTPGCKLPENVGQGAHVVRVWDSFADYVETARQTVNYGSEHRNGQSSFHAEKNWYGTETFEEALALAENGYDEVRPHVDALVSKMEAKIAPSLQPAFTSYFDVSGGSVDVGRYMDGEPECMIETRLIEIAKPGRVITLLVSGGYLGSASTEDILARGAAIVGLCDSLQRMAHETEIWMEKSSQGGVTDATLTHLVKLKNAGEPFNIDVLMYAIAHPSCHRRLTFSIREQEPNGKRFGISKGTGNVGGTVELRMGKAVGATVELESVATMSETRNGEEWIVEKLAEFGLIKGEE